ncbi:serine/threonine-protein kinase 4 [Capsaspora owczarzaki ATCC 30864]|uniref:non-specific serine/threonine protein kinase n=1 Tax=Capsaspora owczarzaki (strain ATCC 30864) TaxID=595528 RepID=A0A0D2USW0_CAPO3|nr:serine/threonine-protein kinase 4 [Capsaspora owczarzaki ATCC 30864]KJE98046.1 STE/STE20/MST protein kinase [Capsaspora owczarzaki ATCC 30864]|eukprot:XP_004342685.2 serine/threonine-protein kinase 4 [Capsaspora owczarzaki ATCC 30864]
MSKPATPLKRNPSDQSKGSPASSRPLSGDFGGQTPDDRKLSFADEFGAHPALQKQLSLLEAEASTSDPEQTFLILERLGKGAFGDVYKAQHIVSGSVVAVKKMKTVISNFKEVMGEVDMMRNLRSPYIVRYFGCYYKDQFLWIAMEFADAGSIADLIRQGPLNEEQISTICYQVLKGLEYLHSMKKLHRDIKAGNILLSSRGRIKLADFGISAQIDGTGQKSMVAHTLGSPYWLAPEVIENPDSAAAITAKSDIWSLGITAIEMAEQTPPNFKLNPIAAMFKMVNGPPPTFKEPEKWSQDFQGFINRCLEKNPDFRPSASDMLFHTFSLKARSTGVLQRLALDYQRLLEEHGSNAGIRGEDTVSANDTENFMRIMLPTGEQRTVIVTNENVTDDVLAKFVNPIKETIEGLNPAPVGLLMRTPKEARFLAHTELPLAVKFRVLENEKALKKKSQDVEMTINFVLKPRPTDPSLCRFVLGSLVGMNNIQPELLENTILEALMLPDFPFVSAVLGITSITSKQFMPVATAVSRVLESKKKFPQLIKVMSNFEVAAAPDMTTLFRSGSLVAKVSSIHSKFSCAGWLKDCLEDVVGRVYAVKDAVEIDSERVDKKIDIEANALVLANLTRRMLIALKDHVSRLPKSFRQSCAYAQQAIRSRMPQLSKHFAFQIFFFDQLLCPAIVFPSQYEIVSADTPLSPAAHRTLVLLSKVVRYLSLGKTFGEKEQYMTFMNPHLENLRALTDELLQLLVDLDANQGSETAESLGMVDLTSEYKFLYQYFCEHVNQFASELGLGKTFATH